MRNRLYLFVVAALVMTAFLAVGSTFGEIQKVPGYPEEVGKILKNSCFACHVTDAKGDKAKAALDFQIWEEYKLTKKISLLNKIGKVVDEGNMPPGKYLENNPDRALSEEQVKLIRDWSKKETEDLMK
jgi:mono/diheme cytochrome c family protein